jgi:hypothetical protein
MLTVLQPDRHVLKETPTAKMFRRLLSCEDVITFWNGVTGEWVLGYYVDRRRKLVDEMEDCGMAFEKVTPEFVQMIVTCWKTVNWKAKKKRILSKESDRVRKQTDDIMEQQERWDWAKKNLAARGHKPLPYAFKTPISGGQVQ